MHPDWAVDLDPGAANYFIFLILSFLVHQWSVSFFRSGLLSPWFAVPHVGLHATHTLLTCCVADRMNGALWRDLTVANAVGMFRRGCVLCHGRLVLCPAAGC